MKKYLLAVAATAAALSVKADVVSVEKFMHAGPFSVQAPMMIDSTDINSKKLDIKSSILDSKFNLGAINNGQEWSGEQLPGIKDDADYAVNLIGFSIQNRSYMKGNLKLEKAPKSYQIFVDGKKGHAGSQSFEPGDHQVIIKYVSEKDATDSLKVSFTPEDDAQVKISSVLAEDGVYTAEKMMESHTCAGVSLSPDGKYMLVTTAQRAPQQSKYWYQMIERSTGRIVLKDKSVSWMPKSNRYYYTVRDNVSSKVMIADPATGIEEVFAENLPEGRWTMSPDEKHLFYSIRQEGPKELNRDVYEVLAPDDRQPGYRDRSVQAIYDVETGIMTPLTFGNRNCYIADVSNDGRYALIQVSEERLTQRPTTLSSYYRLDLQTMKVDTLIERDGFVHGGTFSPDGNKVLIGGSPEAFNRIGCTLPESVIPSMYDYQAYILNIPSEGKISPETCVVDPITKDFDPSVNDMVWNVYDNMIYFSCENQDSVSLYRMNPKDGKILRMDLPEENIKGFDIASNAPVIAFYGQSAMNSDRIYTAQLDKAKAAKKGGTLALNNLTLVDDMSARTLQNIAVAECSSWSFRNSNGDDVLCRYYLPVGFDGDADTKYPMITYYYGGCSPTGRSFESSYPWQIWASLGYVVLVVQPSGAAGFGQEWASRHVNTAGKDPARDIIEAVKTFCSEHSYVNPAKVGCCGASYGGFMTQYLQTVTDIFACAISHAGISDHTTYWGYGNWGYSYSEVSMANSYPWSETDLYVKNSPIYNVDKIHTPILFLHGTVDDNVPINNSIQMFTALKLLGRETSMVLVEGENHGVAEYNKRMAWLKTSLAWFAKYLQDDPTWWNALYPEKNL
ncbi:MAG: prolyl oligopeptidase family serine peptidase [Bacteroidaceae bacterium]|nr:prolyl oligopeptidase family serine peptidase [Bacteroidaceae bacterium]